MCSTPCASADGRNFFIRLELSSSQGLIFSLSQYVKIFARRRAVKTKVTSLKARLARPSAQTNNIRCAAGLTSSIEQVVKPACADGTLQLCGESMSSPFFVKTWIHGVLFSVDFLVKTDFCMRDSSENPFELLSRKKDDVASYFKLSNATGRIK
jgi:hypothetical protein